MINKTSRFILLKLVFSFAAVQVLIPMILIA
jgi:hypothetical protein